MEKTVQVAGGARKECCAKDENLELQPSDRPDLEVRKCRVCGCRHFEATVAPGQLTARVQPLR